MGLDLCVYKSPDSFGVDPSAIDTDSETGAVIRVEGVELSAEESEACSVRVGNVAHVARLRDQVSVCDPQLFVVTFLLASGIRADGQLPMSRNADLQGEIDHLRKIGERDHDLAVLAEQLDRLLHASKEHGAPICFT